MSRYRLGRQGEELVKNGLPGAEFANDGGHDINWEKIKVSVRARSSSGKVGLKAFTFTHFHDHDVVYVFVAITAEAFYFWVRSSKEIGKKKILYLTINKSIPYPNLAEEVKKRV